MQLMADIPTTCAEMLEHLLTYFEEKNSSQISAGDLNYFRRFGFPPAMARACLVSLGQYGYVEELDGKDAGSMFGISSPTRWQLTLQGVEHWSSRRTAVSVGSREAESSDSVPASDRFVPINHNSGEFADAQDALEALGDALKQSNELTISSDERLSVVSEVNELRSHLANSVVRPAYVWAVVQSTLVWLARDAASGVIRTLAAKAVDALLNLKLFG
jgi:hypothetical protein